MDMNTNLKFKYKPYDWQMKSFAKIDRCLTSQSREIMPINACVGSGKTTLASYAFGRFISENRDAQTVSVFVSPRIKLCSQQKKSISEFIDGTFDIREGTDYKLVLVNSGDEARLTDFCRQSARLYSDHTVFVFCDESLWGKSDGDGDPDRRWHMWSGNFKSWLERGVKFGAAFYDEAHNYERDVGRIMELSDTFRLTMLASGTPAHFQKELSRENRKNVCECTPAEAMAEGMICKPSLNLVRGSLDFDFPAAIAAVLKREKAMCEKEPFGVSLLVNCTSIDQIKAILDHEWFRNRIGKQFHVVSIHSQKSYTDGDNARRVLDCRIDDKTGISSQEAYGVVEALDSGYFNDGLPVIVFQVGMIGEGINVKCFNSVIVTTHSDRTAMQQIGRGIRNYVKDGKDKIHDGHANVYAFFENVEDLQRLIVNVQEYDLTEDCFDWGRQIDVSTGSGMEYDDECGIESALNEFEWNEITKLDILEIISAADIRSTKKNSFEFVDELIDLDPERVEKFLSQLSKSEYAKCFAKQCVKFNGAEFLKEARKAKTAAGKPSENDAERAGKTSGDQRDGKDKPRKNVEISRTIIISHLLALKNYARTHSAFQKMWKADNELSLINVFGNYMVGKFFSEILTEKFMKKFLKFKNSRNAL